MRPAKKGEVNLYTSEEPTLAFDSFNNVYYHQNAGMYNATSEKNEMAVGWTQAIMFRDYNVSAPILSIQSYEASSGVEILQVCPPEE